MGDLVLTVLLGASGPLRGLDRWYWRLPWWHKLLWHFSITALAVFGPTFASRLARPS